MRLGELLEVGFGGLFDVVELGAEVGFEAENRRLSLLLELMQLGLMRVRHFLHALLVFSDLIGQLLSQNVFLGG